MNLHVKLDEEIVANGVRHHCRECPVAVGALKAAQECGDPDFTDRDIEVIARSDRVIIHPYTPGDGPTWMWQLPEKARMFISKFDDEGRPDNEPPEPIEFWLENGTRYERKPAIDPHAL